MNDILARDTRIADQIRAYVDSESANANIVKAILNGDLKVRYELVNARPGGRIDVTPFVVDPADVKLDFGLGGD